MGTGHRASTSQMIEFGGNGIEAVRAGKRRAEAVKVAGGDGANRWVVSNR